MNKISKLIIGFVILALLCLVAWYAVRKNNTPPPDNTPKKTAESEKVQTIPDNFGKCLEGDCSDKL